MLWWLSQHLLVTAALAAVVALACRLGRLSPALRHALWVVVLVKLLVPPLFALPWPDLAPAASAPPAPIAEMQPALKDVPVRSPSSPSSPSELATVPQLRFRLPPFAAKEPAPALRLSDDPTVAASAASATAAPTTAEVVTQPGWSRTEIVWLIGLTTWALGSVLVSGWHALRIARFQRRIGGGQAAPRWLKRLVRELAGKFPVRPPRTLVVPGLSSPMLWCLGRPVLLWPACLLEPVQPERWRGVVAHELAHLRRRDHWVGWLLLAAECLWWWNPIFWLVRRQLRFHAELACDAWVVWALPDDRRPYAEALLNVTEHVAGTLPAPVLGVGSGARQALQRRLTMIMCESTPCRVPLRGLLAVGLLALLLAPAWTLGDEATKTKKAAKETAAEVALKKALADLEAKKRDLEKQVDELKAQLAALQNAKAADENDRAALDKAAAYTRSRLADLQNQYSNLVVDRSDSIFADVSNPTTQPRSWGPEQATGAPNAPSAGDHSCAWASLSEDEQDEWLILEYAEAVSPLAIMVYENYNPGALWKVSVFTEDDRELEVWKGKDPTAQGSGNGVSLIQLKLDFKDLKTKKIKLFLKSTEVKGWNEIDAVGLLDSAGKLQWAESATASSSYADRQKSRVIDYGYAVTDVSSRANVNQAFPLEGQRLLRLEYDVDALKGLKQENQQLRDQMDRIEKMLMNMQKRMEGSKP